MAFDFPDSPTLDQIVSGPAGQQFQWDGTKWIALGGGGGGGGGGGNPTNPGSTPPSNPTEGMLWYDTANDILNIWNGSAWVPVSGGSGAFLPIDNPTFTGFINGPIGNFSTGVIIQDPNTPGTVVSLMAGSGNIFASGLAQIGGVGVFGGTVSAAPANQPNELVTLAQLDAATGGGGGPFLPVNDPIFTGTMFGPGFGVTATGLSASGNLSVGAGTSAISLNGNTSIDSTLGSGNALSVTVGALPVLGINAATGVTQLSTISGGTSAVALQIDANGNVLLNRNATLPLGATTLAQMNAADAGPWQTLASPTPPPNWILQTPILYRSLAGGKLVEVNCFMFVDVAAGGAAVFFQIIGILPAAYRPNVGGDNWVNGGMCFANDASGNPAVASTQLTNSGQIVWQSTVTGVNLGSVWFDAIFPVGNIAAGQ